MSEAGLTLVLDVGKTRTKLLAIDGHGALLDSWQRESRSIDSSLGYRALDVDGIKDWLCRILAGLGPLRAAVRSIVPITHGAALAGIGENDLVLPVPDYEFAGFNERAPDWETQVGSFEDTLSPLLPLGLNAAAQLDWLQRHLPERMAAVRCWMPYAQYWAWWLCGVASSEVSSLGCHTLLWEPAHGRWSDLAQRAHWDRSFAPVRRAWEPLGLLAPRLARSLGLPLDVQVLCGAHDSNACLARYLRSWPRMTLVSSGTWVVVMAPGTPLGMLDGNGDFLANVSVHGEPVPTGRFMGGRLVERLCAGASPQQADANMLRRMMVAGVAFEPGAARLRLPDGNWIASDAQAERFAPAERATLAAWAAAQETLHCVQTLGAQGPLVVEGPLAANGVYLELLAARRGEVYVSVDPVEGTARGGFVLARWTEVEPVAPLVRRVAAPVDAALLRSASTAAV